jgi:transposase
MRWALPRRRHRYAERTGISVSITTMHRSVEKLGLRCKKKVFTPASKIPQEYKI